MLYLLFLALPLTLPLPLPLPLSLPLPLPLPLTLPHSQAPERKMDLSTTGKGVPGPGHYNTSTGFDIYNNDTFNPNAGTDIVLQLRASRRRQSHMFESSVERKVFDEVISTKSAPGYVFVHMCIDITNYEFKNILEIYCNSHNNNMDSNYNIIKNKNATH